MTYQESEKWAFVNEILHEVNDVVPIPISRPITDERDAWLALPGITQLCAYGHPRLLCRIIDLFSDVAFCPWMESLIEVVADQIRESLVIIRENDQCPAVPTAANR